MNARNRPHYSRLILAVGLFALALLGGVMAQEQTDAEKKIAKLIEQLGDDDPEVRKAAEKKLIEIGEPALDQVKKAAKEAADADVKLRAIVLSATIGKGLFGQIRTFTGHTGDIRHLAVSKDGKHILSGSMDTWEARAGDIARHEALLQKMRDGIPGFAPRTPAAHIALVEQEKTCMRVRPEEVAATGMFNDIPATFKQLAPAGAWILSQIPYAA